MEDDGLNVLTDWEGCGENIFEDIFEDIFEEENVLTDGWTNEDAGFENVEPNVENDWLNVLTGWEGCVAAGVWEGWDWEDWEGWEKVEKEEKEGKDDEDWEGCEGGDDTGV